MFENANSQSQNQNPAGGPQANNSMPRPPMPAAPGAGPKPEGVEDIFSQMEGGEKPRPPELRPKSSITPPASPEAERLAIHHEDDKKKLAIAGLGLGGLILIFVGLWYSYNIFLPGRQEKKDTNAETANEAVNTNTSANQAANNSANTSENNGSGANTANSGNAGSTTPEDLTGAGQLIEQQDKTNSALIGADLQEGIDSDNDGLNDTEEQSLGTDSQKVDTDGDGLFDKEEVYTYKTDPLNKDTDGDGYEDGSEVKGGYNPKGPGKLYEVK
ncbi:MAG: hypothetical protein WC715_01025 [Patescibacteria group bacterium]|jgi:hypothetical protein